MPVDGLSSFDATISADTEIISSTCLQMSPYQQLLSIKFRFETQKFSMLGCNSLHCEILSCDSVILNDTRWTTALQSPSKQCTLQFTSCNNWVSYRDATDKAATVWTINGTKQELNYPCIVILFSIQHRWQLFIKLQYNVLKSRDRCYWHRRNAHEAKDTSPMDTHKQPRMVCTWAKIRFP